VLLAGSAFAYAFGGHGMFPEEMRELRDKAQWNKVVSHGRRSHSDAA
jgi:hypothetical protein